MKLFIKVFVVFLLWQSSMAYSFAEKSPNIILFVSDDQGYGDLGSYGHPKLKTPNIDAFAKSGMLFTDAHSAAPVCSPSRAGILTGRTPYRNGVFTWIPPKAAYPYLRESELTLPELLKTKGYHTGHFGKWHLNGKFNSDQQPQPSDHGYDYWFATQNNANPTHINPDNFVRNGVEVGQLTGASAVLVVEEAVKWMNSVKSSDKPFFITIWTHEPHEPIEAAAQFRALYPEVMNDENLKHYYGDVSQIDFAFGRLLKNLTSLGLDENTFIVYTSDNGPEGANPNDKDSRKRGVTGGYRGRKRHVTEGGIRVPLLIRWPNKVAANSVNHTPVNGTDFFPTIASIADIPLPSDRTIDGESLVPLFSGEKSIQQKFSRKIPMYWRHNGSAAIRHGDWKLIVNLKNRNKQELYNLATDPYEKINVSKKHPKVFSQMLAKFKKVNHSVEQEGPTWWKLTETTSKTSYPQVDGSLILKAKDAEISGNAGFLAYFNSITAEGFKGLRDDFSVTWPVDKIINGQYRVTVRLQPNSRGVMISSFSTDSNSIVLTKGDIVAGINRDENDFVDVNIGIISLNESNKNINWQVLAEKLQVVEPSAKSKKKAQGKLKKRKKSKPASIKALKHIIFTPINKEMAL